MSKPASAFRVVLVAASVAALLSFGNPAFAATKCPIVQVQAQGSVDQVLGKLKQMVAANGMMIMGELHQGKVLSMTGLHLESETVFVGSPTVGKDPFSADPGAGVALPVRINVFADGHGHTIVSYVPPSHLLGELHNPKVTMIAKMLDDKLAKMTGMLGQ